MTGNEYQEKALVTSKYNSVLDNELVPMILALGLNEEAGEVAGKIKKYIRDKVDYVIVREQVKLELGDVLWYCAVLADEFGLDLDEVMQANIEKLQKRVQNNTIHGNGDNR